MASARWSVEVLALKDRLLKTLDSELGIVKADIKGPVGFHEIFNKHRDVRGILYLLFSEVMPQKVPNTKFQSGDKPFDGYCVVWGPQI